MLENYHAIFTAICRIRDAGIITIIKHAKVLKILNQLNHGIAAKIPKTLDFEIIKKHSGVEFVKSETSNRIINAIISAEDLVSTSINEQYLNNIISLFQQSNSAEFTHRVTQYKQPLNSNSSMLEIAISSLLNSLANDNDKLKMVAANIRSIFGDRHIYSITEQTVIVELLIGEELPIDNMTYKMLERHGIYRDVDNSFILVSQTVLSRLDEYLYTLASEYRQVLKAQYDVIIKATNTSSIILNILSNMYYSSAQYWSKLGLSNKLINLFPRGSIFHALSRRAQGRAHSRVYRLTHIN